MLNLQQKQSLQQKLSPQQIQYIKLLQLPTLALEQRIKAEMEINPLLEEGEDEPEMEAAQSEEEARSRTPQYLRQLLIVLFLLAIGIAVLSGPSFAKEVAQKIRHFQEPVSFLIVTIVGRHGI